MAEKHNQAGEYREQSFFTPLDIIEQESKNPILSSLFLTWAGCYINAFGHRVTDRVLEDYVLIYCVGGKGWLELDDRRWVVRKGTVFICPPLVAHSYGSDDHEPWTKYWLHFRGTHASSYLDLLGLTTDSPLLYLGDNVKILSWMQDVFHILERGYAQSNLLMATSHLSNVLNYIYSLTKNNGTNQDLDIDRLISYMLANINDHVSLDALASYANVSKYHLIRLFKEKTGYTPMDYYIRLKIQRACQLLDSSSSTIGSISTALGYSNAYYFSTTFKRVIGQSPQRYRRKYSYRRQHALPLKNDQP